MKILAFSDLHRDLDQATRLVEMSGEADVVIGAGDFANQHKGLDEAISALSSIQAPTILVPGNNETADALRQSSSSWSPATVLHGETAEIGGLTFFGIGAGVPTTPWGWSFDLDDQEAASMLAPCPDGCVMVLHSPPQGHCDEARGKHLGSYSIADAIERTHPKLAVCGHIHESWGARSEIDGSEIANLGPDGTWFEL